MTSKRKLNGPTSVGYVEDAKKKANLDWRTYFCLAQHVPEEPPAGYGANKEARMFIKLKNEGASALPHHKIAECVFIFADRIHSGECPRKICDELRARMHIRAMRLAHTARQSMVIAA